MYSRLFQIAVIVAICGIICLRIEPSITRAVMFVLNWEKDCCTIRIPYLCLVEKTVQVWWRILLSYIMGPKQPVKVDAPTYNRYNGYKFV